MYRRHSLPGSCSSRKHHSIPRRFIQRGALFTRSAVKSRKAPTPMPMSASVALRFRWSQVSCNGLPRATMSRSAPLSRRVVDFAQTHSAMRDRFPPEKSMPALKNDKFKDYARYAGHCLNMVAATRDQESRSIQREMAVEWLRLADTIRRLGGPSKCKWDDRRH